MAKSFAQLRAAAQQKADDEAIADPDVIGFMEGHLGIEQVRKGGFNVLFSMADFSPDEMQARIKALNDRIAERDHRAQQQANHNEQERAAGYDKYGSW